MPGALPPVLRIDDPADPRIAGFVSIKERDLTGRQGRFIAEGTVVLRMLAAAAPPTWSGWKCVIAMRSIPASCQGASPRPRPVSKSVPSTR